MQKIVTCESVFRGHPDKICDQISDAILDACLEQDKKSRVAIECAIKDDMILLFGEITTNAVVDYERAARRVLRDIGYTDKFSILEKISKQSNDIALGVDKEGAGDQGMMFGYATDDSYDYMPQPLMIAHEIARKMENLRKEKYSHLFGPDWKCQVSVKYENGNAINVDTIIVSTQTKSGVSISEIEPIIKELLSDIVFDLSKTKKLINPTGAFEIGGPHADFGLTGRKIMVDTYEGVAHHGGGAFSGKDPSKVDRSAAYYCRYVAKCIVAAGLAKRYEVAVAYSIGVAEPVAVNIDTFGTGKIADEDLKEIVLKFFNFSPKAIRTEIINDSVCFQVLAEYGHVGREDIDVPWERTNKAYVLKAYVKQAYGKTKHSD